MVKTQNEYKNYCIEIVTKDFKASIVITVLNQKQRG